MEYLKLLKQTFIISGAVLLTSFFNFKRFEIYGLLAAFLCFLIGAIHTFGAEYMISTNQTALSKYVFGIIVSPIMGFIITASFFYVSYGEMHWHYWLIAVFVGLLVSLSDATGLVREMKKTKS